MPRAVAREKINPNQLGLFNEAETVAEEEPAPPSTEVRAHTRRSRGRPALPPELPREEIIHDLDEADKICPHDGTAGQAKPAWRHRRRRESLAGLP